MSQDQWSIAWHQCIWTISPHSDSWGHTCKQRISLLPYSQNNSKAGQLMSPFFLKFSGSQTLKRIRIQISGPDAQNFWFRVSGVVQVCLPASYLLMLSLLVWELYLRSIVLIDLNRSPPCLLVLFYSRVALPSGSFHAPGDSLFSSCQ